MKEQSNLNKRLIAVSRVKGTGKDSVSSMLQYCLSVPKMFRQYFFYKNFRKWIKPKYKRIAFADPLKKMLSNLLNISLDKFYIREFKEGCIINISTLEGSWLGEKLSDSKFNKLVKQLDPSLMESNLSLRQLLQYFGTEIMQKYFGKRVWINSTMQNRSEYTIVSDLRFIEEYNAVKEKKGIVIYVNRPNYEFGQHASEREMKELLENDKYDFIIDNNGSIEDLFNQVKNIAKELE
jgi:hypothetical protein